MGELTYAKRLLQVVKESANAFHALAARHALTLFKNLFRLQERLGASF
jgi:hypothetical protein